MSDLRMSASEAAELLCKGLFSVEVSAEQAAKAVNWIAKNAPPLTEWDIILVHKNLSLSRRQKKKMIKEIRRAIKEQERMMTNENT